MAILNHQIFLSNFPNNTYSQIQIKKTNKSKRLDNNQTLNKSNGN